MSARLAYARHSPHRDHPSERVLDVARNTAELDRAKADLHRAITAEVERAIAPALLGVPVGPLRLDVTWAMVEPLERLYAYGLAESQRVIRRMGLVPNTPPRLFADVDQGRVSFSVRPVVRKLREALDALGRRVSVDLEDARRAGPLDDVPRLALARLANTPGALEAASYLVIPPFNAGQEDVYRANADLFGGYRYSAAGDRNTCDECDSKDGREYASLEEAASDGMDGFGPNPLCYGGTRCRCTLIPLPKGQEPVAGVGPL